MRTLLAAALLIAASPALAQNRPVALGEFGSWTAATHQEGGQKVCYAFTRARSAEGAGNREANSLMLVVTHRANGRDQVAARVGYSYARGAEPKLTVGSNELPFYTAGDNAFARNGRAVVAALRGGRDAVLRGPGPNGRGTATDTFPLNGFSAAYEAISRECPAGRR